MPAKSRPRKPAKPLSRPAELILLTTLRALRSDSADRDAGGPTPAELVAAARENGAPLDKSVSGRRAKAGLAALGVKTARRGEREAYRQDPAELTPLIEERREPHEAAAGAGPAGDAPTELLELAAGGTVRVRIELGKVEGLAFEAEGEPGDLIARTSGFLRHLRDIFAAPS